jgi:hypothetical protein
VSSQSVMPTVVLWQASHQHNPCAFVCKQGGGAILIGGEVDCEVSEDTETIGEPLMAGADLNAWAGLWLSGA